MSHLNTQYQSEQTVQPSSLKGPNVTKRIIVCCDGTWDDGLICQERWKYTNVLRLARIMAHTDDRYVPHVPQVVFYQAGVGTFGDKIIEKLDGYVGASLAEKVQEAYAFIAHNYRPGDEIFLFGFSRGAYTARMVALLIGAIGVLDRTEMDNFADIFLLYQERGKAQDQQEIAVLDAQLSLWTSHNSPGKQRADSGPSSFSIKCVGVFDTVGALGLPEELTHSEKMKTLFGFPDRYLGEHIERAYQALALDEHRKDFNCTKFEQTEGGKRKGQILKQCWFSGSHTDIGGGFEDHDLSDLTLTWMAANTSDMLALDQEYLKSLPNPAAPWGELQPHNSLTGIYSVADRIQRTIPTGINDVTHETIHPSVLCQKIPRPDVLQAVQNVPALLWRLLPYEEAVRAHWHVMRAQTDAKTEKDDSSALKDIGHILHAAKAAAKDGHSVGKAVVDAIKHKDDAGARTHPLAKFAEEHSMGKVVKELLAEKSS
ncbi:uncharacterized protein PHACADRAFT_247474 [Phanerochaete carnosa HHB-10118-sp]|uniref:T6SS Phospholipase effector Tle1-like catalytic domain-containing protein n=1 Tax=Phanerochaete carnosa (strain HHB-10118-sp) TaxID=650164 RepID=K5WAW5_PHACS|nr:uncharacterized protein PHACADRAFT_247474 [Phanerochaete carnosa HHB-10118-sp]EKM61098.1 hypothetical protein PHACADRAFT_247474 [Phanerochaete carnosa HHB-10118-sp]